MSASHTLRAGSRGSLTSFFDPSSVVVVGASTKPQKWGYQVAEQLLAGSTDRRVFLVNRGGEPVHGMPTFQSVADLAETPELAVLTVPASGFLDALDGVLASGTKAIVAITAGFAESGLDGDRLEAEAVARVRAAGARLVGPNCNGIFDATSDFNCMTSLRLDAGSVAVISHSGQIVLDLATRTSAFGLGLSRGVSVGNQADVSSAEFIIEMIDHAETDRILVYLEDVHDGRQLFGAAAAAVEAGKPVVMLAPKPATAARRAAKSHTGSMLSDYRMLEAAADASGVTLVSGLRDLVNMAHVLGLPARSSGRRTAVVADTGGLAVLSSSAIEEAGLTMPEFSRGLSDRLAEGLQAGAGVANPVDAVGIAKSMQLVGLAREILASGEVDLLMVSLGTFDDTPQQERRVGEELATTVLESGKPALVVTIDQGSQAVAALREARVPVLVDLDAGAQGLRALVSGPRINLERPVASAELPPDATSYFGARRLLESYGIPFAAARSVLSTSEALAAGDELGWPVAIKALGPIHKSDAGGVALSVERSELEVVMQTMGERLSPQGFSVERMVSHAGVVELILGGVRDERFGPTVIVGLGGTEAELFADFKVGLAPIDLVTAERMVNGLRGAPLLRGFRGRPAVELRAVYEALVVVSRVITEHGAIAELDINPLLANSRGVTAVDARIVAA